MGIRVECPHGHNFKVKDKYAGKRGLCPHCKGQVVVEVPELLLDNRQQDEAFRKAIIGEHRAAHAAPGPEDSSSVFDESDSDVNAGTSASLLGSSVINHHNRCECGVAVPLWYAKCPSCGKFQENR